MYMSIFGNSSIQLNSIDMPLYTAATLVRLLIITQHFLNICDSEWPDKPAAVCAGIQLFNNSIQHILYRNHAVGYLYLCVILNAALKKKLYSAIFCAPEFNYSIIQYSIFSAQIMLWVISMCLLF